MLLSTFQHLKGIGVKREVDLWGSGIFSWDDLERYRKQQLPLFPSFPNGTSDFLFSSSRKAFEEKDAEHFAVMLPRQEHYRIALSFPAQTIFLDIETTGLSRYYDTITVVGWSIDQEYHVYVKGGDDRTLRHALQQAKVIVTFNGTLFDIPFLRQEFPDLSIPAAHVDLRFLAKRVGLSGGQKLIEQLVGIRRPNSLKNVEGETAPLLWYKALRGDLEAFNLLLTYNQADVEGLKLIFDNVVLRLLDKHQIPQHLRSVHRFAPSPKRLRVQYLSEERSKVEGIQFIQHQVGSGSNLALKDLRITSLLPRLRIVGIDLTGSENRPSGWCFLEGESASTRRIASDDDLIEATLAAKPTLVSIDSPLSLPKGRISVSDEDPGRQEYGITRHCERVLKKRGINVYPSLIRSMQGLTARGMHLAKQLRSIGIPVIESYPGAAQDIMKIPRKRASLEFLKRGLAEFGIKGDFIDQEVSHDELDAITSALVGLFFWSGKFEALGTPEEEYLIIPDIKATTREWRTRKVIGVSGPIASGKTTAGEFLRKCGFHYSRYSLVLADILQERGEAPTREALQRFGEQVNKDPGQRWLCQQLVQRLPERGNVVIDGLRFPEDHAFLAETFGPAFLHVHLVSLLETRKERFVAVGGAQKKFADIIAHSVEAEIPRLATLSHIQVENTGTRQSFLSKIAHVVGCEKE